MKFKYVALSLLTITLTTTMALARSGEWKEIHDLGDRKIYLSFPPPNPYERPLLVWSMLSFKQPQSTNGKTWQSWVQLEEFDCQKRVTSLKKVIFYPKTEAVGQPVQTIEPNETSPVQPATIWKVIFDLICKE